MKQNFLIILVFALLCGCATNSNNQQYTNYISSSSFATRPAVAAQPSIESLERQYDFSIDFLKGCFLKNGLEISTDEKKKNPEQAADKVINACESQKARAEQYGIDMFVFKNMSNESAKAATASRINAVIADFRETITGKKAREKNLNDMKFYANKEQAQQKIYNNCLNKAVDQKFNLSGTTADVTSIIMTECDVELRAWAKFKINEVTSQHAYDESFDKSVDKQNKVIATLKLIREQMWEVVTSKVNAKRDALRNVQPTNPAPKVDSVKKKGAVDI